MVEDILVNVLLIITGLGMLYFGSEWLVRGSVNIAKKLRVSQLVIGLTIVSFGTSSPELVVSIGAVFQGQSDIALGNVVGSNIVNIGLILGLSAAILPIAVHINTIKKEVPIMIGVSLVLILFSLYDNVISRVEGGLLVLGLIAFTYFSYKMSRKESEKAGQVVTSEQPATKDGKTVKASVLIAAGIVLLYFGATFTVENAVIVATAIGISERIVGLTIVAIGTSIPELITTVIAVRKRHVDLGIGNIVGSNIFNVLAIVGISSTIAGISVNPAIFVDYVVMMGFSLILILLLRSGFILSRKEGVGLVVAYAAYLVMLLMFP